MAGNQINNYLYHIQVMIKLATDDDDDEVCDDDDNIYQVRSEA